MPSTQIVVQVQAGVSLTSSDVKVSEVLEVVTRMVHSDPDLGMQCSAAWMLGHLHLSACSVAETRASGQCSANSDVSLSLLPLFPSFSGEVGVEGEG